MKSLRKLTKAERGLLAFQDWLGDVFRKGLWGPSPGGTVAELHCDRSMIDKLAERGILEKSVYNRDGHYVVMISERSIKEGQGEQTEAREMDGPRGGFVSVGSSASNLARLKVAEGRFGVSVRRRYRIIAAGDLQLVHVRDCACLKEADWQDLCRTSCGANGGLTKN